MLNKRDKENCREFLSEAIRQLEKDSWWTNETKTEYQEENNIKGFCPLDALLKIYKDLI
jgi:hypothetical protein